MSPRINVRLGFPTYSLWVSDWGDIRLPDDFPYSVLTLSGWYDKRFGIYPKVRAYIDDHTATLRSGENEPGFTGMPFALWMVCGLAPNRLKGATINHSGDAI